MAAVVELRCDECTFLIARPAQPAPLDGIRHSATCEGRIWVLPLS